MDKIKVVRKNDLNECHKRQLVSATPYPQLKYKKVSLVIEKDD